MPVQISRLPEVTGLLLVLALLLGCGGSPAAATVRTTVTTVPDQVALAPGQRALLRVTVRPVPANRKVVLQRHLAGRWVDQSATVLGTTGRARFRLAPMAGSAQTYRVRLPRSAAVSRAVTIRLRPLWRPAVGVSWQIQLSGVVDLSVSASVFELDGFDTSASQVQALHGSGRRAVCYFSAGSWEDWRPDAGSYPASVLGASNGWPGERWLDIRQIAVLKPILDRRLQMCRDKGFDAVDPDNVDGYANRSGFALTAADQLAFNRWLAAEVHAFGMSVGLKNDLDQVPDLVGAFDFAVNEQCFEYAECAALAPFPAAGKAVLQIEYSTDPTSYCPDSRARGLSSVKKNLDLGVYRRSC